MKNDKKNLLDRFVRYVKVDTQSDPTKADKVHPSTEGQWDLLRMLKDELLKAGLTDVVLDDYGYLLARIPATDPSIKAVGFSAHVDTASDVKGNGVKPQVIENWDGKDIKLQSGNEIKVLDNPFLEGYEGTTIIVSDGTTLLGSDDKAGIAIIMNMVDYLMSHTEIRHGEVEVLFTPDEETGHGMDFFDAKRLHSKALYTVDGSVIYTIEDECFNAAHFTVNFKGIPQHLGYARAKLVNALTMCAHFISLLPQAESPEATDERYGYYCAYDVKGDVLSVDLKIMVRDFDFDTLMKRVDNLYAISDVVQKLYGGNVSSKHEISYKNMRLASEKEPKAMLALLKAGESLGQDLKTEIIRGGTDGARIAEYGIPCPNIYTGAHNLHSCTEWASLEAMYKSYELITELVKKWAELD